MGSIVMNGAKIGNDSIVGAGALVTQDKEFPDGMMILGSPARALRKLTPEEIARNRWNAEEYVRLNPLT